MPIGLHVDGRDRLALAQHREDTLGLVVGVLLASVLVGGAEAGEEGDRSRRGELHVTAVRGTGADGHGGRGHARVGHLRCESPLPDEVVEGELVAAQLSLNFARRPERVARGSDRLVGLLRVLHLAVVSAGGLGNVVVAVEFGRLRARCGDRRLRQRGGVGTHIGDVPALIETLRHPHGALGVPAEAPRGLLLQRGRHEGRLGAALAGLLRDGSDCVVDSDEGFGEGPCSPLVEHHAITARELPAIVEVAAGRQPLPVDEVEPGRERAGVECGGEVPVRSRHERNPLALAVHDKADRDGLNAARGARFAADLLPKDL